MSQSLILAIDQGGQSSRVAIYTSTGEQLHCVSAPCATTREFHDEGATEFIEQHPQEILHGIVNCLEKIHHLLGDAASRIVAAGFAGQGSSFLCWHSITGDALSPVISWQDVRASNYLQALHLTHAQAQTLTGLRVSPHYGASKIRWCLDHNAAVKDALERDCLLVGPIVSYVFWHVLSVGVDKTTRALVDSGHAQRTLLWNLHANQWDDNLLSLFSIPRHILPSVCKHRSHYGDVRLGNVRIPMMVSARDQGASLFAQGMPQSGVCYINIGTGAFIQRVTQHLHAPEGLLVAPLWVSDDAATPSLYAWEATVNGAASAIPFLQHATGLPMTPQDIADALALNPEGDCYFINAVGGLSAPYWRTDVVPQFSDPLSPHEKIVAWIESILFQIKINMVLMDSLGPTEKIIVSGGISQSDVLCQKLANITGVTVYRQMNTDATLQGIAFLAGGMPSQWCNAVESDIFAPQLDVRLHQRFEQWHQKLNAVLSSHQDL